jgi:hypothetical protein
MEAGAIPQHTMTAAISTAVGPDYSILCHAVEINLGVRRWHRRSNWLNVT